MRVLGPKVTLEIGLSWTMDMASENPSFRGIQRDPEGSRGIQRDPVCYFKIFINCVMTALSFLKDKA